MDIVKFGEKETERRGERISSNQEQEDGYHFFFFRKYPANLKQLYGLGSFDKHYFCELTLDQKAQLGIMNMNHSTV